MSTPYQLAARDYFEAGWSPIALPHREKSPVPDGFTGASGAFVSEVQLKAWLLPKARCSAGKLNYPPSNIALRLPKTVIGIDVDAYGTKRGADTLEAAEEAWGALPPTWVSSSRDDGASGIRLFRIPEGLAWPGELPQGKGVELLRWDHRYAIVAPSIHPDTTREYRWYREVEEGGEVALRLVEGEFPAVGDLPELPQAWVEGLTSGKKWAIRPANETMDLDGVRAWLRSCVNGDDPCRHIRSTVTKYSRLVRQAGDDGGAHDSARDGIWAILGDAHGGHSGVEKALADLRKVFLVAVRGRRADEGAAKAEWARAVARGVAKVSAEGETLTEDPCVSLKAKKGSHNLSFRFDDVGNAERLVSVMDDRARWVEAWNNWVLWDESSGLWRLDTEKQVERWCVKAINSLADEFEFIEDPKLLTAARRHQKASSTAGKFRAMQEVARGRKGIIVPAEKFDSAPNSLAVANGVVDLTEDGPAFRRVRREDYFTLSTGVRYVEGVKPGLWAEFIKAVQPDKEQRAWLQKLVGYSLLGSNPGRIMVLVLGPTSTGKTTFAEALGEALGSFAGAMPASVLRDNADDKPRPDLLDALPKRLVVTEELSAAQHLHPDQIKRLTGGSVIPARGMRAATYTYRVPAFTPWLVTNSAPTLNGADQALKRRLLVVPFETPIDRAREVPNFKAQLCSVSGLEEILAWAIEGWAAYRDGVKRGDSLFDIPLAALEANAAVWDEMSDLDVFVSEVCICEAEARETGSRLFQAYQLWCDRGCIAVRNRLSSVEFGKQLQGKGFGRKSVKVDGHVAKFRMGIALNPDWERVV